MVTLTPVDSDTIEMVCTEAGLTLSPEKSDIVPKRWCVLWFPEVFRLAQDDQALEGATLEMLGLTIDMVLYKSGAVYRHSITDRESTIAQRRGYNGSGDFLHNGAEALDMKLSADGSELTITMSGADFTFEKVG